jgi:hypothetical protein
MSTSKIKPAKSTSQYLSRKEAFRLWFECLTRAANNPQFTINTAFYKEWGDWRQLSFNEWWGTVGKALLIYPADTVAIATPQAVNSSGNLIVTVPMSLTPTQAANELRALLMAHYAAIKHTPQKRQSYALTEGAEMKQTVVRSYLHTYDAYQRLVERARVLPVNQTINRMVFPQIPRHFS